jgi:uncharacterized protein YbjT (DUF2867 family)
MYLLTGSTGYIGGRLLRRLERDEVPVRCLCRNPEPLRWRAHATTEIMRGDLLDRATLDAAFAGVRVAYYMVHSMHDCGQFESDERIAAINFAEAARKAGVQRIVYLGGLVNGTDLSAHMRSRVATGEILRASGVPVIELQASIVIGSGSASFEMIRALVERLPLMITPRWVNSSAQPIAIEDVIEYLAASAKFSLTGSQTYQIGGANVTSYAGIMEEYARQRKLRRFILRVPFLSLSLSSRWLTLITPVYKVIGRRLIESARNSSIVMDDSALHAFSIRPMGIEQAIERALANEDQNLAETRWSDARGFVEPPRKPGHLLVNEQTIKVPLGPAEAFVPIRRIGGSQGWYYGNLLWRIRGLIDLMSGGVGMRRGRPDPEIPLPGSTLDFWRVEAYEPGRRLRLCAEMKVPGRAWLEFSARSNGSTTQLAQRAEFEPRGLIGILYWYLLAPVHEVMFRGMLGRIAATALQSVTSPNASASIVANHQSEQSS